MASATNSCRKSETKLSLVHEQFFASEGFGRGFRSSRQQKASRKTLAPFIPHNPLICLDSDERIQGNPSKSNSGFLGFRREILGAKEIQTCSPKVGGRLPKQSTARNGDMRRPLRRRPLT